MGDRERVEKLKCPTCGQSVMIQREQRSECIHTDKAYLVQCHKGHWWFIDFDGDGRMCIEERLQMDLRVIT